jgi:hypothetical protein
MMAAPEDTSLRHFCVASRVWSLELTPDARRKTPNQQRSGDIHTLSFREGLIAP